MKQTALDLDIDRIGSQTECISPEEEKALGEFFRKLKLKYQLEREVDQELLRNNRKAR